MRHSVLWLLLAAGFLAPGCTPFSEQVARRIASRPNIDDDRKMRHSYALFENSLRKNLDPATFSVVKHYGTLLHECADRYGLDWRFILAVMKTESSFCPSALSDKGAFGYMQLMPITGEELQQSLDLLEIHSPTNNILGGVYYLKQLSNLYGTVGESERLKFVLAAYNAGPGRIIDAQELVRHLHGDPARWEDVKVGLGMLDPDMHEIHAEIWPEGRPRSGWFVNPDETWAYVDRAMNYYARYEQVLQ